MYKIVQISKELVDEARAFSKKVYKEKLCRGDKFETGREEESDFLGFLFEFCACDYFGQPKPEFFSGQQVDEFDLEISGLRFDAKHSSACLVNKSQFEKKKGKIDAFLFGDTALLDWITGALFVKFFGWIKYDDVPGKSELVEFDNGSKAYKVRKSELRPLDDLKEFSKKKGERDE